jgi:hypothetical protein
MGYPNITDVKLGVVYGASNELTGTFEPDYYRQTIETDLGLEQIQLEIKVIRRNPT